MEHRPILVVFNGIFLYPVIAGLFGHANELAAIASAIYFSAATYFMFKNNRKKH